jgi:uncharacterized heparinase superfamily protein
VKPVAFTQRGVSAARRAGPHPLRVGRLVGHHLATHWRQRRLRSSYQGLVAGAPSSRLRLPPVALPAADQWPVELRPSLALIRSEAETALAHRVDLLGSGPVSLGPEIDWQRDFKSGFRWPTDFYQDVVVTRLDDQSDAKVPWELSRGHQLLALGRAAAIFRERRFADELASQVTSWLTDNPAGHGINWTNAMEVGIRAINWIWALAALGEQTALGEPLQSQIAQSLAVHGRHIWHNLEGSPQLRGNHYLADVVALLVIAWALPDDPLSSRWTAYARRALEREVRSQLLSDGVSFEASLPYHGLVLELLLLAWWLCELDGRRLSSGFEARLNAALEVSLLLRHPGGRIPQFGDNDSGRILPADSTRPLTHDHLLWMGAGLLGSAVPADSAPHAEVALNLGLQMWDRSGEAAPRTQSKLPPARSFPVGGLHVLRGHRAQVVARCGDVGQNGNGGHAHNDLLSFELSIGGRLVVADPGTYVYTSDPNARNRFRGTAIHSTVTVDRKEINPLPQSEMFRLPRWARPLPPRIDVLEGRIELVIGHDGYRRLDPAVIVRRTFSLSRQSDELVVTDDVTRRGSCLVVSRLQFAPGVELRVSPGDRYELHAEDTHLRIEVFGHDESLLGEGWVSPRFGVREPAPYIELKADVGVPHSIGYRIVSEDEGCEAEAV